MRISLLTGLSASDIFQTEGNGSDRRSRERHVTRAKDAVIGKEPVLSVRHRQLFHLRSVFRSGFHLRGAKGDFLRRQSGSTA